MKTVNFIAYFALLVAIVGGLGSSLRNDRQQDRIETLQAQVDSLKSKPTYQVNDDASLTVFLVDTLAQARLDSLETRMEDTPMIEYQNALEGLMMSMGIMDQRLRNVEYPKELFQRLHDLEVQVKTILEMSK